MSRDVCKAEGSRKARGCGSSDARSSYPFPSRRDVRRARKIARLAGRRICRSYLDKVC